MIKWGLGLECKAKSAFENQLMESTILTYCRRKIRIISVDSEKAIDKIQHTFIIKKTL